MEFSSIWSLYEAAFEAHTGGSLGKKANKVEWPKTKEIPKRYFEIASNKFV
jgi:hypothetical protein